MRYDIDHVFIWTKPDAPEAALLQGLGLQEGAGRTHPGQGTANRRFFFRNAMLELLFVNEADTIVHDLVDPTHLHARAAKGSPFGVCYRGHRPDVEPPFPHWSYRAPFLAGDDAIAVATNAERLHEPFLFFAPEALSPARDLNAQHPLGVRELSHVAITVATTSPFSDALNAVRNTQAAVSFKRGDEHHMTRVFDDAWQGRRVDLKPFIPLAIEW